MSGRSKKTLRVIEVIASISRNSGGMAAFMSDLSFVLNASGFEFHLLTQLRGAESQMPIDPRFRFHAISPGSVRRIQTNFAVALEPGVAGGNPDLMHYHGIWLPIGRAASAWCRKTDIPCVISPHGMLEAWALNHKKWKKRLALARFQRRDLQDAVAFHACSMQEAEGIRRLGFKQPIAVIPNGVVLPDVAGSGAQAAESLAQGALSNPMPRAPFPMLQRRTVLFLSRINPKKGLPMLLDAWAKVAPEDWRLVIAGNDYGDHQKVVEAKIRELNLSENVEVVGPVFGEAKAAAFRNADLFVLPSYSENFGIVVTEALSYNIPVVTTKGCPWKELQTHNCGWWVDATPTGIEGGLNEALRTENEELSAMGRRGRRLVEENYQWPAIGKKFRSVYRWILEGGEKPDFVV
jgi:glycosyltransferase involved in cell wall biosynthesis